MVYFKACGRCKGDVRLLGDHYGSYLQCTQCARVWDLPDRTQVAKHAEQADAKAA